MTVVLYIACSLDGYIATPDGGVAWLSAVEADGEDYGYRSLFDSVDALIMGSRTYEQILGFGDWPYEGKPCWVMSRRELKPAGTSICVTAEPVDSLLASLDAKGVKRVWLVGGSTVVNAFERDGLIDEYIISIVPLLLGEGMPLFSPARERRALKLIGNRSYESGLVQLHYRVQAANR